MLKSIFLIFISIFIFCGSQKHTPEQINLKFQYVDNGNINISISNPKAEGYYFFQILNQNDYDSIDSTGYNLNAGTFYPKTFELNGLFSAIYSVSQIQELVRNSLIIDISEIGTPNGALYIRPFYIDLTESNEIMDEKNGIDRIASLIGKMVDAKFSNILYMRISRGSVVKNYQLHIGNFQRIGSI